MPRSLGRYSSLADQDHGVCLFCFVCYGCGSLYEFRVNLNTDHLDHGHSVGWYVVTNDSQKTAAFIFRAGLLPSRLQSELTMA
jgi:hypothetical protein